VRKWRIIKLSTDVALIVLTSVIILLLFFQRARIEDTIREATTKIERRIYMSVSNLIVEFRAAVVEAIGRVETRQAELRNALAAALAELEAARDRALTVAAAEDAEDVEQNAALEAALAQVAEAEGALTEAIGGLKGLAPEEVDEPVEEPVESEPEVPSPGEVVPDGEVAEDAAALPDDGTVEPPKFV